MSSDSKNLKMLAALAAVDFLVPTGTVPKASTTADAEHQRQHERQRQNECQRHSHLQLLMHASRCQGPGPSCSSPNCIKIKEILLHYGQCNVEEGCDMCNWCRNLLSLHANTCQSGECTVVECQEIRRQRGGRVEEFNRAHRQFQTQFSFDHKLGGGSCREVWLCTHKIKKSMFAVKRICPSTLDKQLTKKPRETEEDKIALLQREIAHMVKINTHPHLNIIRIEECIWTDSGTPASIVIEYAKGINLKQWISKDRLSEPKARMIIKQVIEAVAHLHSLGLMHRDIKPNNVMVTNGADPVTGAPLVKVDPFSLAKTWSRPHSKETNCRAVGLVLFYMVVGLWLPTDIDFQTYLLRLSINLRDLIIHLTSGKCTMEEALRHPWFTAA